MTILLVATGGFFGSIARFYLSYLFNKHVIGTWIANITGSLFLGVLASLQIKGMLSEGLWLLLGIGFCGAYTTFSTFGNETVSMVLEKKYLQAVSYIFITVIITISVVFFILKF